MKLSINTVKLQDMVARAVKGAGMNKLLPITQMLAVKKADNKLTFITTDGTNYLYVREDDIEGDDFYTVVPVELFSKLVAKLTCDSVTLEIKETSLVVSGNGKYLVPIQFEDSGEPVQYPDPVAGAKFVKKNGQNINGAMITFILSSVKPALATTLEVPCNTGYWVGDRVIATDAELINSLETKMFKKPRLISSEMMDLLAVLDDESPIRVDFDGAVICFSTHKYTVYGRELPGIEDYSIGEIKPFLTDIVFPYNCAVSKNSLLELLDRLSLFVGAYDNQSISLDFTKKGLKISSMTSNGSELIPYVNADGVGEFKCLINVMQLTKQIKALTGDIVKISYGLENAIRTEENNLIQITSLSYADDEEAELPFN